MVLKVLPTEKVVVLVEVSKNLAPQRYPGYLEYDNPKVKHITPCSFDGSHYVNLRTGKRVKKSENMLVWNVSVGTMFLYPDGENILVSRLISSGQIVLYNNFPFNEQSMVCYRTK